VTSTRLKDINEGLIILATHFEICKNSPKTFVVPHHPFGKVQVGGKKIRNG
jgi:hypothetical protein